MQLDSGNNAADFIRRLGGPEVAANPASFTGLRLETVKTTNKYGETGKRPWGTLGALLPVPQEDANRLKWGKRSKLFMRACTVVEEA